MRSIIVILLLGQNVWAAGPALSMKEYFSQVGGNNPAYKAAKDAYEGAKKRTDEASLLYVPKLTMAYEDAHSEKPSTQTTFQGNESDHTNYEVSIEQDTPFGLSGKMSYGSSFTDIAGSTLPIPRYYEVTPALELKASLWRNALGSEIRANEANIKAQQQLDLYTERLKLENVRIEAEKVYNNLYYKREALAARKDSLDVATKIFTWAKGRAANELGDDSDMIQARAAQEMRQLEVLKAEDEVREAARNFNSMRGISSDQVADELEPPVANLPTKTTYDASIVSDELRVTEAQLKAAKAQAKLRSEIATPTLDLFGKYALNGLDPFSSADPSGTQKGAADDAWNGDHPAYMVGVRFSTPMFWWTANDVRHGYEQSTTATELRLKRQYQEAERNQINLLARIQNSQKLLELAKKLQASQKEKMERERVRHRRGRTTLFQVLQYEQEYVGSRLDLIRYENDLLNQINDLSLYRKE